MAKKSKTWTTRQIGDAWKTYHSTKVIRFLKHGKWDYEILNGRLPREICRTAIRTEYGPLSRVIGFPEYLEKHGS